MRKILFILCLVTFFSCSNEKYIDITVTDEIISEDYIGHGVEWDPYDEAERWGSSVSEEDWNKLYKRLDFMRPQYVRCLINSPYRYYNYETGKYDKTRNGESIKRLLQYCQSRNITVIYGEYNPPRPEMKDDMEWVRMSVNYLNYLVNELGFSCIKHFIIFNEPDGDWASTNGDYELWKKMFLAFNQEMGKYKGLKEQVSLAGPDVVIDYKNSASLFDSEGWVKNSVNDLDTIIGLYDVHAYPGQNEVRNGSYPSLLAKYKQHIPSDKKIILGEAGYKYWREADSLLMAEYNKRLENHKFTKGSDCNMLCYDYFYGVDMPLLAIEVMNSGYSGLAAWMLDDAMHSNYDSGDTKDIKIWGMWNILGEEVFNKPEEEDIRPWFYTWSLMCRYFPNGSDILKTELSSEDDGIFASSCIKNGQKTISVVNIGDSDKTIIINPKQKLKNVKLYIYEEDNQPKNSDGFPIPYKINLDLDESLKYVIKSNSFMLITEME